MRRLLFLLLGLLLALASRAAFALTCTSTGASVNWNAATTWSGCGGGTPGAGDNVVINNNVTVNVAASVTAVTVNSNTLTQSSSLTTSGALTVAGGTLNSTNTMSIGGATSVTGALNITSTTGTRTFTGNVTINGGGTWNNSANEPVTFGGNLANSGTFTSGTGAQTFSAATATLSGNAAITFAGNLTANGNLTVNKTAGTVTTNATTGVTGNLTVTAGTINLANTTTITGTTSVTGTLGITSTTGTRTFTGTVTINAGGTWSNSANEAVTLRGGLAFNGSTFTSGSGTYTFDTNNQSIGGTSALTIPSVTVTTVTLTNTGTLTVSTALSGTGNLTNAANATLNISGTSGITTLTASATGNTVNYNGAGAQTIKLPAGGNYYNLTASGGNTKTPAAGTYSIGGDFNINSGSTLNANTNDPTINVTGNATIDGTYSGSNTNALAVTGTLSVTGTHTGNGGALNLSGDFTQSGTFTSGAGIVSFTGGASQTFGGTNATTITSLTINKSANDVTIANGTPSPTVSGTLTLTSGNIITDGATCAAATPIIVAAAGTISGGSSSSYVQGALRKNFNAGATLNFRATAGQDEFPIGTTNYTPIEITAGTTSTAGNVVACVTVGDDPNMTQAAGGGIDTSKSVNRYWSMTTTTINTSATANLMNAIFKFGGVGVDTDTSTPTSFIVERYDGTDWNTTTLVSATATSTQAQSINISSTTNEFEIGEPLASFPAVLGSFNAFDTTTPVGAILGNIQTKQVGTSFSVRVVRVANNAIDTTFNTAGVAVELRDSSNSTGGFTTGCRSTWTGGSTLIGSTTANFAAGVATATFPAAQIPNVFRDVRIRIGGGAGCSTDPFAIRPTSITITGHDATWQSAVTSPVGGPVTAGRPLANTGASGGNVHAASGPAAGTPRPFTLRATPQAAGGQSASNYAGTPTTVSGFPTCISPPASCATGTLSFTGGASWTAAGSGVRENATANYTEAGVFNLQLEDQSFAALDAADGSTLATRTVPATATVSIGRFVPDRFAFASANTPNLQTFGSSCASRSFTYIGQTLWYATLPTATVQAVNAAGTVTTNYRDTSSLFKLTSAGISETYSNNSVGPTLNVGSAVSPPQLTGVGNGIATYTVAASATNVNLSYARNATTPIAPFTAKISLSVVATDSSENGVTGNPGNGATATLTTPTPLLFDGGGTGIAFDSGSEFRYGRMRIFNGTGPTTVDVPVTLRAEYYAGAAGFAVNSADNCSSFVQGNFKLSGHQGSLTTINMPNTNVSLSGSLILGLANLKLSKPSPAVTTPGSVKICLDLDGATPSDATCAAATTPADRSYLQGPWSGSSNYDKDPTAQVNLGLYGSQPSNFIFFRENY